MAFQSYDVRGARTVPKRDPKPETQLASAAARVFMAGDRINQQLISVLDPAAWRAQPATGVRPIVAIFTHMHNVRCKWIRLSAPHLGVPSRLSRSSCTPGQAAAGLAASSVRCSEMIGQAFDNDGLVPIFRRDAIGSSWPAGVEMLCYMTSHEAHHRGQICLLAHQLGFPLSGSVSAGFWNWEKVWKDSGWQLAIAPQTGLTPAAR
jgi:uncharacterized damage-inducible protein DinB